MGNKNKGFYGPSAPVGQKKPPPTPVLAPLAMQTEFDVAVVGGGIVGLATAREVQKRYPDLTVVVVEKEREVAPHQSSHNSGVIHAGMYYVPGSAMALTCVRGAKLMYEYLESRGLPYDRVGYASPSCPLVVQCVCQCCLPSFFVRRVYVWAVCVCGACVCTCACACVSEDVQRCVPPLPHPAAS